MSTKKFIAMVVLSLTVIFPIWAGGSEKGYPTRPISLLIGGAPGGVADLGARAVADMLSNELGQQIVSINKTGGGGYVAGNGVVIAKPDGYTLGFLQVAPSFPEVYTYFQEAPYTSKDLKPICRTINYAVAFYVKKDSPWNSFKEVIEYSKAHPGLKVGTHAPGSIPHILMIVVEKTAKVSFTNVPFVGDTNVLTAVLGGHVPFGISAFPTVKSQMENGTVRVLAISHPKSLAFFPNIPTIEDMGYKPPVYSYFGIFAPKETPNEVIKKLDLACGKILAGSGYSQKAHTFGGEAAYEGTESFNKSLGEYKENVSKFLKEMGYSK